MLTAEDIRLITEALDQIAATPPEVVHARRKGVCVSTFPCGRKGSHSLCFRDMEGQIVVEWWNAAGNNRSNVRREPLGAHLAARALKLIQR